MVDRDMVARNFSKKYVICNIFSKAFKVKMSENKNFRATFSITHKSSRSSISINEELGKTYKLVKIC